MATKPTYEPDALYLVKLARPVKIGRTTYLPSNENKLKGKLLEDIKADVLDAVKL